MWKKSQLFFGIFSLLYIDHCKVEKHVTASGKHPWNYRQLQFDIMKHLRFTDAVDQGTDV